MQGMHGLGVAHVYLHIDLNKTKNMLWVVFHMLQYTCSPHMKNVFLKHFLEVWKKYEKNANQLELLVGFEA